MNLRIGSENESMGLFSGRPLNSTQSREFIVESIETVIRDNNGVFPETGFTVIEKLIERE
jgi:hypothetical protein